MQTSEEFPEKEFTVIINYNMVYDRTKEVIVMATEPGNAEYEAKRLYGNKYPNIQGYTVV